MSYAALKDCNVPYPQFLPSLLHLLPPPSQYMLMFSKDRINIKDSAVDSPIFPAQAIGVPTPYPNFSAISPPLASSSDFPIPHPAHRPQRPRPPSLPIPLISFSFSPSALSRFFWFPRPPLARSCFSFLLRVLFLFSPPHHPWNSVL